jgi:hypothetical protein
MLNYDKAKHLEFIQNAITRMAQNSFMCKGWAITLFSALIIIEKGILKSLSSYFPLIICIVISAFWFLDSYYLRLERLFRELYDDVRMNDYAQNPYSMKLNSFAPKIQCISRIMFSISEWPIYIPLVIIAGLVH